MHLHQHAKRWAFPSTVCPEFSVYGLPQITCTFETESAKCYNEHEYQVYCGGCFNRNKARDIQKAPKQACPPNTRCINTKTKNAWGEMADYVLCSPEGEIVTWTAQPTGQSSGADVQTCSPGLTNNSGRDAKVEITVSSFDSAGKNLITPAKVSLVLNSRAIEVAVRTATLAASLILRNKASVQGCITIIGSQHQVLKGQFALQFLK